MKLLPALAVVVLTFSQVDSVPCPQTEPLVTKNSDGTYKREHLMTTTLQMCYAAHTWYEEWSDYPEKGGHLIREMPVWHAPGGTVSEKIEFIEKK